MSDISNIVDLDRYPISDLTSVPARAVIDDCKAQLRTSGLCLLPGFVRDDAVDKMCCESRTLAGDAHYTEHWRATPNGDVDGNQANPDRTLAVATRASMSCIGFDRLAADSPTRYLYQWDGLTEFINAVLGNHPGNSEQLYNATDPIVSCMLTVLNANDELGWHYDPNDCVVSLSIQQPIAGGEFEFAPRIRAPHPDAAVNEQAVLEERYPPLVQVSLKPGTLSLFNGHRSLHRVTPVRGARQRIVALFNYSTEPNYYFKDEIKQRFFGRKIIIK